MSETKHIQPGSVEYYEGELGSDMRKLQKMLETMRALTVDISTDDEGVHVNVGPRDGLSEVSEMLTRIGSLGHSISYNRNKIMDKIFYLKE